MYNKKINSRNDLYYVITEMLPFEKISGIFNLLNFEAENINLEIDILTINDNQFEELCAYVEDCISMSIQEEAQKKKKMVKAEKKPKKQSPKKRYQRQQKPKEQVKEEVIVIQRAAKKPTTRKSRKRITTSFKKPVAPAPPKKKGRKRKAASTSKKPLSSSSSSVKIEPQEDNSTTIYIGPVKSNPLNITRISETKRNHIFGREQIVKLEKNEEDEDEYIDVC
eukprot:TRINITY_DN9611_c0_g1_i4.p1 TRINITY_DN9611_c0_g1~~TRINITY_DN9611_c0_g1_i4.p1  ORF type:complete len:223 (+),score=80.76 TRINITY_DN9611_c0_g1_i4:424-1092(+)